MSQTKIKTLYPHPFSKAYWKDAAGELKDTRVLVFAALMIALRVAMKLVAIPLAPRPENQHRLHCQCLGRHGLWPRGCRHLRGGNGHFGLPAKS